MFISYLKFYTQAGDVEATCCFVVVVVFLYFVFYPVWYCLSQIIIKRVYFIQAIHVPHVMRTTKAFISLRMCKV